MAAFPIRSATMARKMEPPEKTRPFFRAVLGLQGLLMLLTGLFCLIKRDWMPGFGYSIGSIWMIDLALTCGTPAGKAAFKQNARAFYQQLTYKNVKRGLHWAITDEPDEHLR